jgi:hypothetical protein
MSFIVIWLHFFLQTEKSACGRPRKNTLPLITADKTNLDGIKKPI